MKSKKLEKLEDIIDKMDNEDMESGKFKFALSDIQETPDGSFHIIRTVNHDGGKWYTDFDIAVRA